MRCVAHEIGRRTPAPAAFVFMGISLCGKCLVPATERFEAGDSVRQILAAARTRTL